MSEPICLVTSDPIDSCALLAQASARDGAAILFVGLVRNHNEGRGVGHLDYQAYPEMAEATIREIVDEARSRWETGAISVIHRIGRLEIGDASVAIAVSSPHRGDAYEASRYVIEELKKRVPIWKKEGYLDGDSEWLRGNTPQPVQEGS
ncbi:MAG: molybdenum cofactor biosynthesis protein MoaE [Gemmatimonadota bacterium]